MNRWSDGGAVACARAASTAGVMSCLSSLADGLQPGPNCRLEEVAQSSAGPKIFQLYIRGDDDYIDDHVRRALAAGYDAFAITVDVQLVSRREGMITSRYQRGLQSLSGGQGGVAHQAGFDWDSLRRFTERWPELPLLVKGIMSGADARTAVDLGVAGVWVSNHGGRQLDHAQVRRLLRSLAAWSVLSGGVAAVLHTGSGAPSDAVRAVV
jgi:isopentenyl diphosphate isomerase/L-lactate dehydrogenase-like FMN-dependent dehydrogenase